MAKARWNPETGERVVFSDDETPPKNFLPCHPADPDIKAKLAKAGIAVAAQEPEPQAAESDDRAGMSKEEVVAALKAGNIEFKANASKAALTDLLITELKKVLTVKGVAFDENETAKSLLDKVTAPAAPQGS